MEKHPSITYLIEAGLREDQAMVYTTLLERGKTTASKLAGRLPYSRPMVYRILDELINIGAVSKNDEVGAVSIFECAHPLKLRDWMAKEKNVYEQKQKALESTLTDLISLYSTQTGKPGVRVLQGLVGLSELYEDVLNEQSPLCLIRSPYDDQHPEISDLVIKQIEEQVKIGITTQAITPFDNETIEELETIDHKNLVTRRLVYIDQLDLPAQIIIYADKVALTAFDGELMTTIIQNKAIATTFQLLFELIWQTTKTEDENIRQGLRDGTITAPRPR